MKQTDEELERLLRSYLDPDDEHPDLEDLLFRHADGTLDGERRAEVEAHLEHCARCREDAGDAVAAAAGLDWLFLQVAFLIMRPATARRMPGHTELVRGTAQVARVYSATR